MPARGRRTGIRQARCGAALAARLRSWHATGTGRDVAATARPHRHSRFRERSTDTRRNATFRHIPIRRPATTTGHRPVRRSYIRNTRPNTTLQPINIRRTATATGHRPVRHPYIGRPTNTRRHTTSWHIPIRRTAAATGPWPVGHSRIRDRPTDTGPNTTLRPVGIRRPAPPTLGWDLAATARHSAIR